jgi:exonuclease III
MNSYSHNQKTKKNQVSKTRRTKIIENITSFSLHNDIICLQESHTPENSPFYNFLPKTLRRFSNPASNSALAGTDIFVRKDFAQFFDIKHILVAPGHIQLLRFSPKGDRPLFNQCFTVMNVYLPSGSGSDYSHLRDSCLTKLCEVESDRYVFAAGDWNMTEHESDSAGGDHKATSRSTRQLFTKFLSIHGLTEVYQPTHTFFRATSSSRLDRIYVSHSPAEKCLMAPSVSIPSHPHMPGTGKDKGPSDHFPVQLAFYPAASAKHTRFKIPKFIANDGKFLDCVRTSLSRKPHLSHPVKAWLQFKAVIRESAIFVMRELRLQALNKAALLTKAIGVFRSLRSGAVSFGSALHSLRNETSLHAAVLADSKSSTVHLKHVQGVISSVYKSHPPVVSPKTQSFLKSAKNSLPGESKSLLTHLFEDCT